MKLRQTVIKVGVVFLLLLVALTFFSRTIKTSMLPKVRVTMPAEGTINRTMAVYNYEYANMDTGLVIAEGSWVVDDVFVKEGDMVEENDLLYTIDTTKYRAELLRLQAAAVTLDNTLENPYLSASDRKAIELDRYAAWQEYRILRDSYPTSGEVPSPYSGTVMAVNIEQYDNLTAGDKVIEIFSSESKNAIKFDVTFAENSIYMSADTVNIYYKIDDRLKSEKLPISAKERNDGNYTYYVEIPGDMTFNDVIQYIEIVKRSATYNAVIPTSTVHQNANGYFVYAIEEEQKGQSIANRVAQVGVKILEEGDGYTAIEFPSYFSKYSIIQFSTKPIAAGDEVVIL